MTVSPLLSRRRVAADASRAPSAAKLVQAQHAVARARHLQGDRLSERIISVLPAMADLLPDRGLKAGATYGVDGSTALTAALIAGPSADGLWCAVVGMPGFSAEAAERLGCDLAHVVFVPHPGRDWVNVVAALIDALTVVVVRPSGSVSDAEAARLSARLRQREAVLIACGRWPRTETRLSVSHSTWMGLGPGHGHLMARRATITVTGRGAGRRSGRDQLAGPGPMLWLPDAAGNVCFVDDQAPAQATESAAAGRFRALQEAVG